mmetsp:Transcript_75130/g.211694  ORF Transcript_75130/g.211694 Transcript_75130/m.211694 type:complete len:92 (+) Transcript_75130:259-534(+)
MWLVQGRATYCAGALACVLETPGPLDLSFLSLQWLNFHQKSRLRLMRRLHHQRLLRLGLQCRFVWWSVASPVSGRPRSVKFYSARWRGAVG